MPKLFHPDLPKGQNETEVSDKVARVLKKNGWKTKPPTKKSAEKEERK